MASEKIIIPGGVDEYISGCPIKAQDNLRNIRAIILNIAPDSVETTSYFNIPGYSYEGYDYNGMFVWFSFKEPFIRLHVRPPVIDNYKEQLSDYSKTKSIVSFPFNINLPENLIKNLVEASLNVMKETSQ